MPDSQVASEMRVDERISIDPYLARRRNYMRLPRLVALVFVIVLILLSAMAVGAFAFISYFTIPRGSSLLGLEPSLGEVVIVLALLSALAALYVGAAITLVNVLVFIYRRTAFGFNPLYLAVALPVVGGGLYISGETTAAIAAGAVILGMILYVLAGRAYVSRATGGSLLVASPRTAPGLFSGRYRLGDRTGRRSLRKFLLRLSRFFLIVMAAMAVLMTVPLLNAIPKVGDSLTETFGGINGEPSPSPTDTDDRSLPNPALLLWIAYAIWLRPYLARIFTAAVRGFKADVARSAAELFLRDPRRGILFLRPFTADHLNVTRSRTAVEWILGVPPRAPIRLEEALADVAFRFGPVAALRNPDQSLTLHLGAARDASTPEAWQQYVRDKLSIVDHVVLVLGRSEGLKWEIQTIMEQGMIEKLIIVVPPGNEWQETDLRRELPQPLAPLPSANSDRILILCRCQGQTVPIVSGAGTREAYEEALLLAFALRRSSWPK